MPEQRLEEGSTVKIIISNGKETKKIAVPNLKGRSEADAAAKLQEVNLVGNPSYEYSDDVKEGQVISQDPEVNTEVDEGTTVSYVVSKETSEGYILCIFQRFNIEYRV